MEVRVGDFDRDAATAPKLGALISIGFCLGTTVPGQAFLKRWKCAAMTAGSQTAMIFGISLILALWR